MAAPKNADIDGILAMGKAMGGDEEVSDAEAMAVVNDLLKGGSGKDAAAEEDKAARRGRASSEDEPRRPAMDAEARSALERGAHEAKLAVAHDTRKEYEAALPHYDAAVDHFGVGLADPTQHQPAVSERLVQTMVSYLDRASQLRQAMPPDAERFQSSAMRTQAIENMARYKHKSFSALSRGVACRKAAIAMEQPPSSTAAAVAGAEEDAVPDLFGTSAAAASEATSPGAVQRRRWQAFVLYSEAIDCFMAYAKTSGDTEPPPMVSKALVGMMDKVEALKAQLSVS